MISTPGGIATFSSVVKNHDVVGANACQALAGANCDTETLHDDCAEVWQLFGIFIDIGADTSRRAVLSSVLSFTRMLGLERMWTVMIWDQCQLRQY